MAKGQSALIGQNIRGYQFVEEIGEGSFATVYRAKRPTLDAEIAIKVIHNEWVQNPTFAKRFEREAQLIARLEHPHITPLYDYWQDTDYAYLVTRYYRHGTLRHLLGEGALSLEQVKQMLEDIVSALAYVHRQQIIHRDIKPSNILLDKEGHAYLADFGIAKDLLTQDDPLTESGYVAGTLDYSSPEQLRSETLSTRSDIFSLGVTLYEMLTGVHPFAEISQIERAAKLIHDPLPDITQFDKLISEALNTVIRREFNKSETKAHLINVR